MNSEKRILTATTRTVLASASLIALLIGFVLSAEKAAGGSAAAQAPATPATGAGGVPVFKPDPTWPKVPAKWKLGDVSSVAVDAQNHIWVLHRYRTLSQKDAAMAAPPVVVFDEQGNFVKAWGGPADGYEWPEREHGIHIDYKGFVWIGGNNCPARNLPGLKPVADDQLLKFTQDGKFVMQIGHSNMSAGNSDTKNLQQPADAFVYKKTNEIFVADGYGNHRVAVFDADTGAFKRMWGAFSGKPADLFHCPQLDVTLAETPIIEEPGPPQFSIVHAIRVSNDGLVYVADREYRRVQVFTIDGKFVNQLLEGDKLFARDLTLSNDPEQRFLFVGAGDEIAVVDRKSMKVLQFIKGDGIRGGGHEMIVDAKGNLYAALTNRGVQKLTFVGMSPATK